MDTSGPSALSGARIGILLESDFVEDEIAYYRMRFAEEGAEVQLLTRLWGNDSLVFTGHEYGAPLAVDGDLEEFGYAELSRLAALIVPSGMVADRLRYTEDVETPSPALRLLRRAFRMPRLLKAFSCHALWLLASAPELVRQRPVTCHNNLVGDVRNMGAHYVDNDVVVDGDLITGRSVETVPGMTRTLIRMLAGE